MQLFGPLTPVVDFRPDGVTYVRSAEPLPAHPDTWIDRLEYWATVAPDRAFLAERDGQGGWRTLTYKDALDKTMRLGSWLLAHGASADRPLLAENKSSPSSPLLARMLSPPSSRVSSSSENRV